MTVLSGSLFHASLLFERLKNKDYFKEESETEEMVDSNLNENISKQLKTADNSVFLIANSLSLYFDIEEDESLKFKLTKELHNNMGLIGEYQKIMDDTYDYYVDVEKTVEAKVAAEKFLIAQSDYKNQIQKVLDLYNSLNTQMTNVVKSIRNEMRKFELN